MTDPTPATDRCQFLFGTDGAKCQAVRSHPIHRGINDGPDRAHEFQVTDQTPATEAGRLDAAWNAGYRKGHIDADAKCQERLVAYRSRREHLARRSYDRGAAEARADALRDIEAGAAHLHAGGGMTKQQRASIERWAAVHIRQARADERERLAGAVRAIPVPVWREGENNDLIDRAAVLAILQPDTASES